MSTDATLAHIKMHVHLILFIFTSWLHNLAATSRTEMNGPKQKQFQGNVFDDLLQYALSPTSDHRPRGEQNTKADFLSKLVDLSSNFNKNYLNDLTNISGLDISKMMSYDFKDMGKRNREYSPLHQKINEDIYDAEKTKIVNENKEPSPFQENELASSLFNFLMPYLPQESEKGEKKLIELLKALGNGVPEGSGIIPSTSKVDTKVLKSPVEIDVRTGTKFYDSRPNVTDLLINIRNITKDKLGYNQTGINQGFDTTSPIQYKENVAFGEPLCDQYFGPTVIYQNKNEHHFDHSLIIGPVENKATHKRKVSEATYQLRVKPKIKRNDIYSQNQHNKNSIGNWKIGKINQGSIKTQSKRNDFGVEEMKHFENSLDEPDKFSLVFSANASKNDPNSKNHTEKLREPVDTNDNLLPAEPNNSVINKKLTDQKNINVKEKEISALTARIVADIVKEIDERFRNDQKQKHEPRVNFDKKVNLSQETEKEKTFLNSDDNYRNKNLQDDQTGITLCNDTLTALREKTKTLESLNLPLATTKLTIKETGIPLYKIPNSEIYIYELGSRKKFHTSAENAGMDNQHNLMTILGELISNNSVASVKNSAQTNSDKISKNLTSFQSIFKPNLLPDIFDSLPIFLESEAGSRQDLILNSSRKSSKLAVLEDLDQAIPEIEIHIKNMPQNQVNKSAEMNFLHKKPVENRHEPIFSHLSLNNVKNQKANSILTELSNQQKTLRGSNQFQIKKNVIKEKRPKMESDNSDNTRSTKKSFWDLNT